MKFVTAIHEPKWKFDNPDLQGQRGPIGLMEFNHPLAAANVFPQPYGGRLFHFL